MLAEDAIKSAISNYYTKNPAARSTDLGGTGASMPKIDVETVMEPATPQAASAWAMIWRGVWGQAVGLHWAIKLGSWDDESCISIKASFHWSEAQIWHLSLSKMMRKAADEM